MSNYKKLYEIEGFDTGTRIRHKDFGKNSFYFYSKVENEWLDESGEQAEFYYFYQFQRQVWEVYEEPKKERWVKFYRVFDTQEGYFSETCHAKDETYIWDGFLKNNISLPSCEKITKRVGFEALVDEHGKVLKYRFPNNEIIEVQDE